MENLVHGANGMVFNSPPKEQGNVSVLGVEISGQEVFDNGQAVNGREPFGGRSQLSADVNLGFGFGETNQLSANGRRDFVFIAEQSNCPAPDGGVGMG